MPPLQQETTVMDIITQANTLKFAARLVDRSASMTPTLKLLVEKPLCPNTAKELQAFPRARPEDVEVDPGYIADFLSELSAEKSLDMHGVLIVRNGRVICDAQFGAYRSCFWQAEHSLSKSVTATAIGMLIDDGKLSLDDRAVKLLEKRIPPFAQLTHKGITVRHLLTMTSGITFSESGAIVEENWIRAFFESRLRADPGKVFNYNSMNTFILSSIVHEVSGVTLYEFLKSRLFEPLGITVCHWEKGPDGNELGGWGLYLRREDAAKIAKLYLDGGVWNGKRLISEKWCETATSPKINVTGSTGNFDYGYQIWCGRNTNSFLFNGMFGQDAIAFRDTDTVVVSNAGIEQIFQQSVYYDIVEKYFGKKYYSDDIKKYDKKGSKRLSEVLHDISDTPKVKRGFLGRPIKYCLPDFLVSACGKSFSVPTQEEGAIVKTSSVTGTANIGLLPIVEQVMRNRYTKGITAFSFAGNCNRMILTVTEGNDCNIALPIIPNGTEYTVVKLSETEYHLAVTADTAYDEDGRGVLKLRLSFPEISGARLIKIYFDEGFIDVKLRETPGLGLVKLATDVIEDTVRDKKTLSDLVSRLDADLFYAKIKSTVEPEIRLTEKK